MFLLLFFYQAVLNVTLAPASVTKLVSFSLLGVASLQLPYIIADSTPVLVSGSVDLANYALSLTAQTKYSHTISYM